MGKTSLTRGQKGFQKLVQLFGSDTPPAPGTPAREVARRAELASHSNFLNWLSDWAAGGEKAAKLEAAVGGVPAETATRMRQWYGVYTGELQAAAPLAAAPRLRASDRVEYTTWEEAMRSLLTTLRPVWGEYRRAVREAIAREQRAIAVWDEQYGHVPPSHILRLTALYMLPAQATGGGWFACGPGSVQAQKMMAAYAIVPRDPAQRAVARATRQVRHEVSTMWQEMIPAFPRKVYWQVWRAARAVQGEQREEALQKLRQVLLAAMGQIGFATRWSRFSVEGSDPERAEPGAQARREAAEWYRRLRDGDWERLRLPKSEQVPRWKGTPMGELAETDVVPIEAAGTAPSRKKRGKNGGNGTAAALVAAVGRADAMVVGRR